MMIQPDVIPVAVDSIIKNVEVGWAKCYELKYWNVWLCGMMVRKYWCQQNIQSTNYLEIQYLSTYENNQL